MAELCARRGRERVAAAMDELLAYSERVVRAAIARLPDGRFEGADVLETPDGLLEIRAAVTIAGDSIDIDFEGTAPQYDGNLNCPLAVTRSACFYVVRCLTAPDLPASGGAFVPVTVRAPAGLPRQRPIPRRGGRGQHGDVEPDHRRRVRRVRAGDPRAGPGSGDDEQRRLRKRPLHLLRDDRRRPGRVPATRTARPASTSRCRTPSTRRSRRSSSRIRSVSSATSSVSDRAARDDSAAETASFASFESSSRAGSRCSRNAGRSRRAERTAARTGYRVAAS